MSSRTNIQAAGWGAAIGTLGGLIGLGGAEFRLPVLLGPFRFRPLDAVILNKAMSLVVVAAALLFRTRSVPAQQVLAHGPVVLNLLAGSLIGAWVGAGWATRLRSDAFYRIIAVLLFVIAALLLLGHESAARAGTIIPTGAQYVVGVAAGFVIGVIAALLGVAGGEFIIPTLVLLFGLDVKLAGSLSLAISLPTMLTGFARYSRDRSFVVLKANGAFVLLMALGSICGAWCGGLLLGVVPADYLLPALALILVVSAIRIWLHGKASAEAERSAFAFEPETVRMLTHIPLRFRMSLDLCAVHLSQQQWNRLSLPARQALTGAPCSSHTEIGRLRDMLARFVRDAGGGDLQPTMQSRESAWRGHSVPDQVRETLQSLCLPAITADAWSSLSDERRFALLKLTRPGHLRNLESALREFGLIGNRA